MNTQTALTGMTQSKWSSLSQAQKEAVRDYSGLSPQLKGLEGCRVEVLDNYNEKRRFIVGMSTGWKPCHLEIKRVDSTGGDPADKEYRTVTIIKKVR